MKKIVLWIIGVITMSLGFIGIFIPVFPTTPFLLVALACFVNSSSKMHRFILENKYLGPYVKDFTSDNGIPMRAKWRAVSLIWITIGFSAIFVLDRWSLRLLILSIAAGVSIYIFTRKTAKSS